MNKSLEEVVLWTGTGLNPMASRTFFPVPRRPHHPLCFIVSCSLFSCTHDTRFRIVPRLSVLFSHILKLRFPPISYH